VVVEAVVGMVLRMVVSSEAIRRFSLGWMSPLLLILAMLALLGTGRTLAAEHGKPLSSLSDALSSSASAPSPETQLVSILDEIDNNRLNAALEKTDALLKRYPNFRLAHLIKGDLLLARSRPLSTFGNVANAPPEQRAQLADLREEAIARLKATRDKAAAARYVPRYLLQLRADQKHALVVDTQKARLYVYRNDDGRPRFVADYYITHGKQGSDKLRQGDRKTPVGVYHVTSSLPAHTLDKSFGSGAFPLNYPNEWDKRQGRDGNGIWLHGTPPDTFSRPPKASDGCIVLTNADLLALAKNLQLGLTPVIISNSIEWLSYDDWQSERTALNEKIEQWRTDLESRDYERFIRHYAKDFKADGQNSQLFVHLKNQLGRGKEAIKLTLSQASVFRNPGREQFVVVTFDQDIRSNSLSSQTKKSQYWIREDGTWKIIYEGNA
jgi:murein L,D-transpeptidase YafK